MQQLSMLGKLNGFVMAEAKGMKRKGQETTIVVLR
jgi:hypothetical protein